MSRKTANKRPPPAPPNAAPDSANPAPWPRLELLAAAALSLWIIFLHLTFLFHAGPLWRDEVGSIDFASMPTLSDIWQNLRYDNFPPLFLAVARAWTLAGMTSDFSYRILGFCIGMGTLGVLWFGARGCGAGVPLLALALYAVNPLAIRVGDAMRPYGLGIALTMLALALTWKFVENPRPRSLFWATVVAVLSVQCLYQNVVFLAAFSLAAWAVTLARKQWKTAAQTLVIGAVAALSLLPHLGNMIKGRDWLAIASRPVQLQELGSTLVSALNASGAWAVWFWAGLAAVAVGATLLFGICSKAWKMIYFTTALVAAVLFHLFFLLRLGLQPRSWYFLILLAPAALALDAILAGGSAPPLRLGRAGLALLLALLFVPACYAEVRLRQSNADLVAETLKQQTHPGDLILVSPWYYGVSLQRYFGTNGFTTLPPMQEIRIHRYDLMKNQMESENPIGPLLQEVGRTLRSGHALWVAGLFQFPPPGPPQPVYPPYHGGMNMADSTYFSSWMFQISRIVQARATSGGQVRIPVPGGATIHPAEDIPLLVFRGWKE